MPVHIGQRKFFQVVEGLDPQIPDNPVGDLIVDMVHDPLGNSGDGHRDQNPRDHGQKPGEIHLVFPNDIIHAPPGEDGDIEGQPYRQGRQKKGEDHQRPVGTDVAKDPSESLSIFVVSGSITHWLWPPFLWNFRRTGTRRSPGRPGWKRAALRECHSRRARRRRVPGCGQRPGWRRPAGR